MSKTAQAIKSGVVMGGTAILSAVNGLTPHMAGAIDIMVVQQPDGSLKCSPFYVRFGKYTPMRSKDKKVQIFVNGEEACFSMHLGAYGQAYFAAETMEIVSDAEDELLTGMMSPSSGYSSDDEEGGTPYANASMLAAVQQEVARMQAAKAAAAGEQEPDAAATAAGDASLTLLEDGGSITAAAPPPAAAGADAGGQVGKLGPSSSSSMPAWQHDGAGQAKQRRSSSGRGPTSSSYTTLSGSESDGETSSSSSGSSGLSECLPIDVAAALQEGLSGTVAAADGQQVIAAPPSLPPITTPSSNGNAAASRRRSSRKQQHLAKRVLQVSGDGAAGDPARSRLQEMLLDNKYSIKMQSDASFTAAGSQQQDRRRSKSPLKQDGHTDQLQQQRQEQEQPTRLQQQERSAEHSFLQGLESVQLLDQQQQQPPGPMRHVGFQLPPPQEQHKDSSGSADAVTRAARAAGAAGANGVQQLRVSELPSVLLDSAASFSMDEVSEGTGLSRGGSRVSEVDGGAMGDMEVTSAAPADAPLTQQAAAAGQPDAAAEAVVVAAEAAGAGDAAASVSSGVEADAWRSVPGGGMKSQPTLAEGLAGSPLRAALAAVRADAAPADGPGLGAAGPGGPGPGPAATSRGSSSPGPAATRTDSSSPGPAGSRPVVAVGGALRGRQQSEEEAGVISPNRASLLSSSLKAHQQQQQLQQSPKQSSDQVKAAVEQQQQQQQPQADAEQQPSTPPVVAPAAAAGVAAAVEGQRAAAAAAAVQRTPSVASQSSSADADATAILDDAAASAAEAPLAWGGLGTPGTAPTQLQQQQQEAANGLSTLPGSQQQASSSSSNSTGSQPEVTSPAAAVGAHSSRQQLQQQEDLSSASAATAAAAAAAMAVPRDTSTSPVSMPKDIAFPASPPADSGYLGDSEAGALLGTSYEGATPRRGAAAAALAAAEGLAGPGAGPLALGLAGFQLSLCGALLRPGITPAEAQQVFETRRVSGQVWAERGVSLMADQDLVVKVGANLYSWQVAAPMVVGMLAFGGKWDSLLGVDPSGMYPMQVAEDHAAQAAKKSSASSSWRLWPFTGWREPSATPKQQQQQQMLPGSSPSQQAAAAPPAAAGAASAASLQPSGGSFTNLRALLAPGSKSAPDRAGYGKGTDGGEGGAAGAVSGGGVDAAVAGRMASFMSTASSPAARVSRKKHIILIRKTLTPTSEQLNLLPLRPGANTITFRAGGAADLTAYVYLLRWNTRLVVSDVDGTITRSDLLGHVLPTLGVDWSHPGITQLFHNIARNGYQIMFLSSRAIAQANITREYLHTLVQNDFKMPSGPVIISPHGLLPSLYREIVVRRPHEFKIACLQDIRALFPAEWNPFYAAFGNRDTDEVAYREVGVPLSRTFTINPKGQIQKASTAVQSSTWSSLSAINDLVDEMFPGLLQHASSSINRGMQSVYSSFHDTLEFAASLGAIQQDVVAAMLAAEQQRRRSSSSTGGGSGGGAGSNAALTAVAEGDVQQQQQQAGRTGEPVSQSAANTPTAAAAMVTAAAADDGAALGGRAGGVEGLLLENVGPAREEYNDLHYWRPALYVDIDEELAAVSARPTAQAAS